MSKEEEEEVYWRALKIVHTWRADGTEEIRVAASDASLMTVSLGQDQVLRLVARDRPPQNEEGTDEVALTLIERLNQFGGDWGPPVKPEGSEEGVDFIAAGPEGTLKIQVTRSFTDVSQWRQLARESLIEYRIEVPDAVEEVWRAIQKKAGALAPAVRATLHLALDTMLPPLFAPRAFMVALRSSRATDIQGLGFREVWLVGPTELLTWRVDEPFPPGPRNIT